MAADALPAAAGSLPAEPEALPPDAVEVGRVLGAWGVQGGLKVKPFAAHPEALFSTKRWYLRAPQPPRPGVRVPPLLRIVSAREQGDTVVAKVHDLTDRDAAEALKGATVLVPRTSFPTPDEGEHYWVDLIGLTVLNRGGHRFGRVDHLIETGPHCVLAIVGDDPDQPPTLIPFVDAYVDQVDTAGGRILVDWGPDY